MSGNRQRFSAQTERRITHFHQSTATVEDIERICLLLGSNALVVLDCAPSDTDRSILGLVPCRLGARYRRDYRCRVNGDGYYTWRRELLDSAGHMVGSVHEADGGAL